MAMLDEAKAALRIGTSTVVFNTEVEGLIAAAKADLKLAGIAEAKAADDNDPLVKRAVLVYVKANFGFDNPDAEKLQAAYSSLKMHMSLSAEYTSVGVAP